MFFKVCLNVAIDRALCTSQGRGPHSWEATQMVLHLCGPGHCFCVWDNFHHPFWVKQMHSNAKCSEDQHKLHLAVGYQSMFFHNASFCCFIKSRPFPSIFFWNWQRNVSLFCKVVSEMLALKFYNSVWQSRLWSTKACATKHLTVCATGLLYCFAGAD